MKEEKIGLIVRTVIGALSLLNAVLQMNNLPHLEIGDEVITTFINSAALIITAIWNYWKNNNWTPSAQIAQNVLNALKKGETVDITIDQKTKTV